jgi:hypothetical protein
VIGDHFPHSAFVGTIPLGRAVWVTARGSNAQLGFSAADLLNHPRNALRGDVRGGRAPVGLAVVNGGRRIVVADSNRFNATDSTAALTVVNAKPETTSRARLQHALRETSPTMQSTSRHGQAGFGRPGGRNRRLFSQVSATSVVCEL